MIGARPHSPRARSRGRGRGAGRGARAAAAARRCRRGFRRFRRRRSAGSSISAAEEARHRCPSSRRRPTPQVAWQASVGKAAPGFAPAVTPNAIYAAAASGTIVRVDPGDAAQSVWRIEAGQASCRPASARTRRSSPSAPTRATCSRSTPTASRCGRRRSRARWSVRRASPTASSSSGPGDGRIFGLVGRRRQDEMGVPAHATRRSPCATTRAASISRGGLFVGTAGGKLLAIDLATGNVGWEGNVATPEGRDRARAHRRRHVAAARRGAAGVRGRLPGPRRLLRHPARHAQLVARRLEPLRASPPTTATSTSPTTRAPCTRSTRRPAPRRGSRTSSRRAARRPADRRRLRRASSTPRAIVHLLDRSDGKLVGRAPTDGTPPTAQPALSGDQRGLADRGRHALRRAPAASDAGAPEPSRRPPRRELHAAHPRPRRPAERRQVDAVQPADADARRAGRRFSRASRATATTAAARVGERRFIVVDTGGFEPVATRRHPARDGEADARRRSPRPTSSSSSSTRAQGSPPQDRDIADLLRRSGRPVVLAVNKAEGLRARSAPSPSSTSSGWASRIPISSAHGENVAALVELALVARPAAPADDDADAGRRRRRAIKVAIVGRPERRQVDARQHAARRGARDRVRRARHDARRDLPRLRARRAAATR